MFSQIKACFRIHYNLAETPPDVFDMQKAARGCYDKNAGKTHFRAAENPHTPFFATGELITRAGTGEESVVSIRSNLIRGLSFRNFIKLTWVLRSSTFNLERRSEVSSFKLIYRVSE